MPAAQNIISADIIMTGFCLLVFNERRTPAMENIYTLENLNKSANFMEQLEGDGAIVISPVHRIMSANSSAEKILMVTLNPGQALNITKIMSGKHLSDFEDSLDAALVRGLSHENLEILCSPVPGNFTTLVFSINPIFDKNEIIGAILSFRPKGSGGSLEEPEDENLFIGYNTLFDQMAEGVFTINSRWKITAFNKRAQEITGFTRNEVLGSYCWDIFRSDLCKSNCPLKRSIETGTACMDQDIRIVVKGGRSQSILVNTSAIRNNQNRVVGAIETFRPLTITKETNEASGKGSNYLSEIIGESPQIKKTLRLLPDVAASEATVIIEGEPGTGKELIAKAIHQLSKRSDGPFIAVNCSTISENMLELELFGHARDAFKGAVNAKVGKFELAMGGTLFLDEVADIKPETQIKILRALEEGTFERVAGLRTIPMNARIIAATNKNLATEVREGRFREDLYYRLRTVPIYLPPLRERKSDIPLLISHTVAKLNKKFGKKVKGIDPKVQKILNQFSWPGNIRELERILEYAFVFVKGPVITTLHLPEIGKNREIPSPERSNNTYLWEEEKNAIENALKKTNGRRDDAAQILGISRTSLWRKMKTHRLIK